MSGNHGDSQRREVLTCHPPHSRLALGSGLVDSSLCWDGDERPSSQPTAGQSGLHPCLSGAVLWPCLCRQSRGRACRLVLMATRDRQTTATLRPRSSSTSCHADNSIPRPHRPVAAFGRIPARLLFPGLARAFPVGDPHTQCQNEL